MDERELREACLRHALTSFSTIISAPPSAEDVVQRAGVYADFVLRNERSAAARPQRKRKAKPKR